MPSVSLFVHSEAGGTLPANTKISPGAQILNVDNATKTLVRAMVVSNVSVTLSHPLELPSGPGFHSVEGQLELN
jgi:hypothetical protein